MKLAFYRMKNNIFIGDCFAVVCCLDCEKTESDLTRNEIVLFIKPSLTAYNEITSIEKLKSSKQIFGECSPILRVGSECMFGIFGDSHCECEPERLICPRFMVQEQC